MDMDKRKGNNIEFRLERFKQKIGNWAIQLARLNLLTVCEKVKIIKGAVYPAILYGLEFCQTLHRSKGKINDIDNKFAMLAKKALGVSRNSSNLKALIETGLRPFEL